MTPAPGWLPSGSALPRAAGRLVRPCSPAVPWSCARESRRWRWDAASRTASPSSWWRDKAMAQAHCHGPNPSVDLPQQATKVVLVGNPNVGKSAVFHALTGIYVEVSNYPGTTVDVSSGRMGDLGIYDTPGVYGVSSFNEE